MLGLVEAELAARRRRGEAFHRRADDGLERAEVRVMQELLAFEPCHHTEDLAVALARRAHDELRGRRADAGFGASGAPPVAKDPTRVLELREQVAAEILLASQVPYVRIPGAFEVDGYAVREPRRFVDLLTLGPRQELDVDVAREAFAPPQQIERREHAVRRTHRASGHA